jgi:hypothetical protein
MAGDLDAYLSSGAFPETETAEDKTPTASQSPDELAPIPRLKELADEANKTAIRAMSRMMSSDTISKSKLARRRVGSATIKLVARFDELEKALQNNADLRLPPPSPPTAMPPQLPAFPVALAASATPLSEEPRTVSRSHGPFGGLASVRVLGVLMTIHGLLAGFVGGLFVCGLFVCGFEKDLQEKVQHPQSVIIWGVSCIVVSALVCVVQVAAGVMLFLRRGRTFGLIASIVGFASVVTIFLVPSATILAVYGLIVLFNPRACQAFAKSDGSQPGTGRQATQLDRKAKP